MQNPVSSPSFITRMYCLGAEGETMGFRLVEFYDGVMSCYVPYPIVSPISGGRFSFNLETGEGSDVNSLPLFC
jgi:hypothetical protein